MRSTKRLRIACALALGALAMLQADTAAQTRERVRFHRIADTSTPTPGGPGSFSLFHDARSLDGGLVVFAASTTAGSSGLYVDDGRNLRRLVDTSTVVPGAGTTFSIFYDVEVQGGMVLFTAGWGGGPGTACGFSANEGVFAMPVSGSVPAKLADTTSTPFGCFHGIEVQGARILVTGGMNTVDLIHNHQEALLELVGLSQLVTLVDVTTPVPGAARTFVGIDQEVADEGHGYAFAEVIPNTFGAVAGLYLNDAAGLRVLADAATPVPGGTGTFSNFASFDYDGNRVAFMGRDSGNAGAAYVGTGPGDLRPLVNGQTRVPGTTRNFLGVSNPIAFADGQLVFSGYFSGGQGLFLERDGRVERLLVSGDLLGGKPVTQAFCLPKQFDGTSLMARVHFSSTDLALYRGELVSLHTPR